MNKRGFTLIEILISISITAIIMTLLYGTFRATIASSEAVEQQAEPYRISRIVFYQLTKDLIMVHQKDPPSDLLGLEPPFGSLPLKGEDRVRVIDGGVYSDDTIAFTSLSYQPDFAGLPISGTAEISYSLSGESLLRDARFLEKEVQNEVGESVLGFNLRYFEKEKQEWVDDWIPSRETPTLPSAIEVELVLKESTPSSTRFGFGVPTGGIVAPVKAILERKFKTIVEIPVAGVL